ncbi:uncharacterized protein LOC131652224 [Vicia villosa]|uniref:uncharacterized protein LOC131652224 n=1 Tax=Vicia villosa TaxID=3911 RepID=UPI00273BD0CD|nr:uncharacterized protein LOC131652224 [Vicia villosa]
MQNSKLNDAITNPVVEQPADASTNLVVVQRHSEQIDLQNSTLNDATTTQVIEQPADASTNPVVVQRHFEQIDMQNSTLNDATTTQVVKQPAGATIPLVFEQRHRRKTKLHLVEPEPKDAHEERHQRQEKRRFVDLPEQDIERNRRYSKKNKKHQVEPVISNDEPTSPATTQVVEQPADATIPQVFEQRHRRKTKLHLVEPEPKDAHEERHQRQKKRRLVDLPEQDIERNRRYSKKNKKHQVEPLISISNDEPTSPVNHPSNTVHVSDYIDVQNIEPNRKTLVEPSILNGESTSTPDNPFDTTVHVPYIAQETDTFYAEQEFDMSHSETNSDMSDTESKEPDSDDEDRCLTVSLMVPELSSDIVESDVLEFDLTIQGKYILSYETDTPYIDRFCLSLNLHFSFYEIYSKWKYIVDGGDPKFVESITEDSYFQELVAQENLVLEPGLSEIFCVPITIFLNTLLDGADIKKVIGGVNMILEASESERKLVQVKNVDDPTGKLYAIKSK